LIPAFVGLNLTPLLLLETPPEHPGWRVINLLVFAAVLAYIFVKKVKIGELLDKRASTIKHDLEQAKLAEEKAEKQLAEIEARLSRLDRELADIKAQADVEAQREQERINQSAAAEAEKIQQLAKREIEGATKSALTELQAFVAEQSVALAEAMIRKDIRPEDNARILSQYADELREVAK